MRTKRTKVNEAGYRWELGQHPKTMNDSRIVYTARAQMRCTFLSCHNNTVPYFRYMGVVAEFDTTKERDAFLKNYSPQHWVGGVKGMTDEIQR